MNSVIAQGEKVTRRKALKFKPKTVQKGEE